MQNNIYNIYLITAKQAGNNIRRAVCLENGFSEMDKVSVKYHGKDQMVNLVDNIMRYSKSDAIAQYERSAMGLLDVRSTSPISHHIDVGTTFVDSVLKSKDARNCQKQLIDYMMGEMYLQEAFQYDAEHHLAGAASAMARARLILQDMFSLNFISHFLLDQSSKLPVLDANLREQLIARGFDPLYACTTLERALELSAKKYIRDFTSKKEFFSADTEQIQSEIHKKQIATRIDTVNYPVVQQRQTHVINTHPNPSFGRDLWQQLFVQRPTKKRRRRFINLQQRHADILECGRKGLAAKKQYATIDYGTKHNYINNYYTDGYADNTGMSKDIYFFARENQMYGYIWNTGDSVAFRNGKLYFPDGAIAEVEHGIAPYEALHKINAVYAALFGFSADDVADSNDWLFNSVRSAYTDEGNAWFRLQMIEAREQGRM